MLGDERLLGGREEPSDSPRLKLWYRKWDISGQSKSCQWDAEAPFFNSHRTQMSVMPCGGSGGHPEFNEREESGAVCDSSTAEHEDRGSRAQIGRKAGARQRGSNLSVHAGRC